MTGASEPQACNMPVSTDILASVPKLPRLKAVRERQLMTQEELAARSGIGTATISRLENGWTDARFSTVRKLAAALGVEPQALMGPEDSTA
jgi:transcriptional regulator with XRE-family HTH domain